MGVKKLEATNASADLGTSQKIHNAPRDDEHRDQAKVDQEFVTERRITSRGEMRIRKAIGVSLLVAALAGEFSGWVHGSFTAIVAGVGWNFWRMGQRAL